MSRAHRFMILAGEVSGDLRAAGLIRALRERAPGSTFFGIGGERMRHEGAETFYDVDDLAVTGVSEALCRRGFFRRVFLEMWARIRERQPDALLLVDYPGFNLRFAERARTLGVRSVYYICPQVWAWHRSRVLRIAKSVNRLITIFPFEKAYFEGTGLPVDFVGHPLVDEARAELERPLPALPWRGSPRIALLPGSRAHEIRTILPVLWRAAGLLNRRFPDAGMILAAPSAAAAELVQRTVSGVAGGPRSWSIVTGETRQVLRQARAALVASGTATLEASLMACPTVIVYRVRPLTYLVGRLLIRVPHLGIVNIVAGREICPEFLQGRATPEAVASAMEPLLGETPQRAEMLHAFRDVNAALGPAGAEGRAADLVLETVRAG